MLRPNAYRDPGTMKANNFPWAGTAHWQLARQGIPEFAVAPCFFRRAPYGATTNEEGAAMVHIGYIGAH